MTWITYNTATGGIISYQDTEPTITSGQGKAEVNFNFGDSLPFIYKYDNSSIVRNDSIWIKYSTIDNSVIEFSSEEPTVGVNEAKVLKDFFYNPLQPLQYYKVPSDPSDDIEIIIEDTTIEKEHRHIYFAAPNNIETNIWSQYIPSKIQGNTTQGFGTNGLTMTAMNRIENISDKTLRVEVIGKCSGIKDKSKENNFLLYVAQTGAVLIGSRGESTLDKSDTHNLEAYWIGDLAVGQYVELYIVNLQNKDNAIICNLSLSVKEL